jgi:hypothetical protein
MENIIKGLKIAGIIAFIAFIGYSIVGTSGNVAEIKKRAPEEFKTRNWKILRYEGFEYGSWSRHGGKVWYHVMNTQDSSIQYRVYVCLWDGELQYYYGAPEKLNRINISGNLEEISIKQKNK